MQYTINGIPEDLDRAVREQAKLEGLSHNDFLVRALRFAVGLDPRPTKKRDLSGIFDGTPLEPEVLKILEEQRQIDPELWK